MTSTALVIAKPPSERYDLSSWNPARDQMRRAVDYIIRRMELRMMDAMRGARRFYYEPRLEALVEWWAKL